MVIKNLTNKLQDLWIKNLLGGRSVKVQVLPGGSRELAHTYIPDRSMMPNFDKIFEIEGIKRVHISESITTEDIEKPDTLEDSGNVEGDESSESTVAPSESPETNESKFICTDCGAEFGSARGLASHQSRAHAQL